MITNPRLIKLISLVLLFAVLNSCKPHKPGIWENEKIEQSQQQDFQALNKQLLDGLKANSPLQLERIMTKEFIDNTGRLRLIELCSNRLKEDSYRILDEYYIVNTQPGYKTIEAKNRRINNYTLKYNALTREMYMVFFVPKSIPNKYMVSATYCKFDYGWKLTQLEVDPYSFNGKTAPELFEEAKEMYNKNYLFDAMNDLQLAQTCAMPFDGWQYGDLDKMHELHTNLAAALKKKYRYPFTLIQVPTRPRIFEISIQKTADGVYPLVNYMSSVKLKNIAGLQKENDNIKKVIGKVIPGIDQGKKFVYFDAFNEWPRYDRSVDRYEMIDELK